MTRFLAILAALTCAASAQTYRTVTADTNNVIRTNFTLGAAQISGSFAISNVTGLQSALDGKLATNGDAFALTNFPALLLRTNGSASGLTNFPTSILQTNSSLSAFPAGLLRTNGDGSGLTNLPNADLGSATGILPLANGGTGGTNASEARTALELGTAATNDATAFQPADTNLTALAGGDGSNLTNVTITDASTLTNFPAELLRTNGDAAGLTNFPASVLLTNGDAAGLTNFPADLLRTNGDGSGLSNVSVDLTTVLPSYSGNDGKVLAVATGGTNVEWTAISNTVTDASTLTNFPASILQTNSVDASFPAFLLRTNGSAAGLTSFPASLLTTNGSAAGLTNFPTLNQNTTGTASNVTGVVAIANGGSGQTTAAAAIEAFLPAYSGNANRILALNSNANGLEWTTNAGGGGLTSPVAIVDGGTGASNAATALTNLTILNSEGRIILSGSVATNATNGIAIGTSASVGTTANAGIAIGQSATVGTSDDSGIAIGRSSSSSEDDGIAIGANATASGIAAQAIGDRAAATATSAIQLGIGTNSTAATIQWRGNGNVNSTEWGYLANASTKGGSRMTNTNGVTATNTIIGYDGTNYVTNTITVLDGIITSWTQ